MKLPKLRDLALNRILSFFAVVGVVGLLTTFCHVRDLFRSYEGQTWDARLEWFASATPPDRKIKIIMIDQTSLDVRAEQEGIYWPWPRGLYVPVIEYLAQAGAKGVAFDMLFTEPSSYAGDDKVFASAVGGKLPVILGLNLKDNARAADQSEKLRLFVERQSEAQKNSSLATVLLQDAAVAPSFQSATLPIPELLAVSRGFGNVRVTDTSDKIFRFASPGAFLRETPVLDLPFALYDVTHPNNDKGQRLRKALDVDGRFVVRFHGAQGTYDSFSIDAVIQSYVQQQEGKSPQIPLSEFKDAFVFVGSNADGILDLRPTPLSGNYPGVEYNATVFDNILHENFFVRVPTNVSALETLALVAVAASGVFFVYLQAQFILTTISILLAIGLAWKAAYWGYWLPIFIPVLGTTIASIFSYSLVYYFEGRQRRFLKNAFGYYVSPEVIDRIVKDPTALTLGGERRELTIFFSDLVGFTRISERLEPPVVAAFLNLFLSELTDIILGEGGTVDKYEGDAIIAFWNAPLEVSQHEIRCVRAALRGQARLREMASEFEAAYGLKPEIRVGIHTGDVVVGNFGSRTRFNYTMIGDAANLAARLEGANRAFGCRMLVSQVTRERCGDAFLFRRIGQLRVVGRSEPVVAYEPHLLEDGSQRGEWIAAFNRAVSYFEAAQFKEARQIFEALERDSVIAAYLERMAALTPAETATWSPVWELTSK